jgi:hypothetical protein
MKRLILSFIAVMPLAANASSPVGLLPEDKVPVALEGSERNPFGKNAPKTAAAVVENEESRIRAVFERLPVGGVMEGRTGRKVLLGSFVIEEGRQLPPVIPRQSEKLKVLAVAPDKVELAFLESDGTPGLRRIVVNLNMSPSVQFRVSKPAAKSQPGEGEGGFDGVLKKDELGTSR